ncbi:uncharacterized protein LOC125238763 isoform X2 [Leguminivora glycinivorella]|uniref:uncharacterized protein LOC125238763 isoform X2 n=1 Tax=Leguminivora glycinivorella TaxID=1035111 RepID=UPI00200D7352|nr:uncharacterized protein LOC125238763 isoform X2 [Leguminivora glycinivorella]
MIVQVLLLCLYTFVRANLKDDFGAADIGAIPYENAASPQVSLASAIPESDYGGIPYEKVITKTTDEYGNVPYEETTRSIPTPVGGDYGNVPYEAPVVPLTPSVQNRSVDIPGILLDIFKGRDVPVHTRTTVWGMNFTGLTPAPTTTKFSRVTTTIEFTTVAIQQRADTTTVTTTKQYQNEEDYSYPGTVTDDPTCSITCSTCTDPRGYRRYCLNGSTTQAPTDLAVIVKMLADIADVYWSRGDTLYRINFNNSIISAYPNSWPACPNTTSTAEPPSKTWAPHNRSGETVAKCFVCGMLQDGIPEADHVCADSFLSHSYRRHCKFLNREGWHINGSGGFYMWGRWTGGCSLRYVDISNVYHQRTCRSIGEPALGSHYVSRRMAKLEYALRKEKDACISSPTASLVPLSRGISLFSRFHACVCSENYCNRAERLYMEEWSTVVLALSLLLYGVLQGKLSV